MAAGRVLRPCVGSAWLARLWTCRPLMLWASTAQSTFHLICGGGVWVPVLQLLLLHTVYPS